MSPFFVLISAIRNLQQLSVVTGHRHKGWTSMDPVSPINVQLLNSEHFRVLNRWFRAGKKVSPNFHKIRTRRALVKAVIFGYILATYFTPQPAITVQELELLFSVPCRIGSPVLDTRVVEKRDIMANISQGWIDKGFSNTCAVLSCTASPLTDLCALSTWLRPKTLVFFIPYNDCIIKLLGPSKLWAFPSMIPIVWYFKFMKLIRKSLLAWEKRLWLI